MQDVIKNTEIGFIGIGNMGSHMIRNLASDSKYVIRGYDANSRAMNTIKNISNVSAMKSGSEAAQQSEIIILMLPNGPIVEKVLIEGGVFEAMPPGGLIIDMSSSTPQTYKNLAPHLAQYNVDIIDAPVSGGVAGAKAGTLTIMAGGAGEHIERARPLLSIMGDRIFNTGALGSGQATKALNNLLSAGTMVLTIETLLLGKAYGLNIEQLNNIINVSTGRNNTTDKKVSQFILNRKFNSGFALQLLDKDAVTALKLTSSAEKIAPLSQQTIAILKAALDMLGSNTDHTQIVELLEKRAGISLT